MATDVGWDFGRVEVPATATECPNMPSLMAELAKYAPGGPLDGQAGEIAMTGGDVYGRFGIDFWSFTNKLKVYGRQDGTTQVRGTVGGGNGLDRGHAFRMEGVRNVEIYNIDFNAEGQLHTSNGVQSATILGAHWAGDTTRADVFNIHMQGCRFRNSRQAGIKVDGDGGTDGVTLQQCTAMNTGLQWTAGDSEGFGEGIYCGDGNSKRAWSNITFDRCHVFNVYMGEGIEMKLNGTNGLVKDCWIHDVLIDNGGGLKFTDNDTYQAIGNSIWNIGSTPDSDTEGYGIFTTGGGTFLNNTVWNCERATVGFSRSLDSGRTSVFNHNTFAADNGSWTDIEGKTYGNADAAFYFTGNFGNSSRTHDQLVTSQNDCIVGSRNVGSYSGASWTNDQSGSFVGPTSGDADGGEGPGSGFVLSGGNARNAVGALVVAHDARGYIRVAPTDAGAYDADGIPPSPPPPFVFTSPTNGQTGFQVGANLVGTCTPGDQVEVLIETDVASPVTVVDWSAAVVVGSDFTFDPPSNLSPSTAYRARLRRP